MYEDGNKEEVGTVKHVKLANEMAGVICEFTPGEQNEMVRIIYDIVFQNRKERIDSAEKVFIGLKESLVELPGKENDCKVN